MKFSMQGAQDNGEFFTPPSIVKTLVNVIEPDHGIVYDPACGSGGMFVQSSHFLEQRGEHASHRVTFYGNEYKTSNIRLALMNLAVHALEGSIKEANTFYDEPHELIGKCDFVMANPPFNVDMVDAERVKTDRRLSFGLPDVNKNKKVSNGNYLWISYFHSYLNVTGRAGFVMSSQASSAGHGEAEVRRKLVETGDVDVMIAIRSNFFYTRTVPCELWFFDRGKPSAPSSPALLPAGEGRHYPSRIAAELPLPLGEGRGEGDVALNHKGNILMLDARNVYRKVTRKIYDFSPEQQQNLAAIVWLYRGQTERFVALVRQYLDRTLAEAVAIAGKAAPFRTAGDALTAAAAPFIAAQPSPGAARHPLPVGEGRGEGGSLHTAIRERDAAAQTCFEGLDALSTQASREAARPPAKGKGGTAAPPSVKDLSARLTRLTPLAAACRDLVKDADLLFKLSTRVPDMAEKDAGAKDHDAWDSRAIGRLEKELDARRKDLVEQLKTAAYFERQAHWLLSRFPDGKLVDVPGLVKLVSRKEIEAADWSLTPGRYVDVAPPEDDEDFDFEQILRDIHTELADLNAEAAELATTIQRNFEGLGV